MLVSGSPFPNRRFPATDETLLLVQLVRMEHVDAVEQAEEIMALPGVDGCFVGPVDLALSLGLSRHRSIYEQHPAYQMHYRGLANNAAHLCTFYKTATAPCHICTFYKTATAPCHTKGRP